MESGILAIILLGIVILILVPFIYYGVRSAGYPKVAIIVCVILTIVVLIPMVKYGYRDQLYSHEDGLRDLTQAGIEPKKGFKLVKTSITGYKHLQQVSVFILDTVDVNKAIARIERNPDYLISPVLLNLKDEVKNKNFGSFKRVYRFKNNFIIEGFSKPDDYTASTTELILRKNMDTVLYKKIDEY